MAIDDDLKWSSVDEELPKPGVPVDVILRSGVQGVMQIMAGKLWSYPGESCYVYVVPEFWRPI